MIPSILPVVSRAEANRETLKRDLMAVARGDGVAMARVYASTAGKLNALLIRILHDPGEAEEVLQDVYLTIWRRSSTYDPARASPITWLITIARNRAIDRLRLRKVDRSAASTDYDGDVVLDAIEQSARQVEEIKRTRRLSMCLEKLDTCERKAIHAAFFEGLKYQQLAEREGVPIGTMKSWIRRGLLRLRRCMTAEQDE
jgi:RNA polymerase sigma-70 factor, ECF subfamily